MMITPRGAVARFFFGGLIVGRATLAITSLAAPRRSLRLVRVGGDGTPAPMIYRMFGVRNGLLALGLYNLDQIRKPRLFIGLNVLIDSVDALAFVAAGRRGEVSRSGATVSTLVAMSAIAAGAISYANLEDGDLASA
ncbi:hypothetical protein [Mycolicibacterium vinylchloridicum]|uniref:hypothetical protein n=1 Tax=Mycolicibacterium vinylchloridicum TaxID=2736928 RepID=UPI001F276437|nr:hypothetical protein [Mycolicibacterium vinylchloridicum]